MQSLDDKHLTLALVKLKRLEAWPIHGQGFSFLLAQGGNGQYISKAGVQNLLPGDVLLVNSTLGGEIVVASDAMVFWCFSVCFEHLSPLFAIEEISMLQNTTESLVSPKLYPASSALAQECHRLVALAPPQGNVAHRSQVLRVAAAVLSAEFTSVRSKRAGFVRMEDHVMQVLEDLSANELLNLSVGEMAHKFSCSRRHLNRLFHQHFGCSVASLRMEMRLLKALTLLRDPKLKIIDVAEQCGFNHLGLFNMCFKKRFGNTPGQWRKHALHAETPVSESVPGNPTCPMHAQGLCPWTPNAGDRPAAAGGRGFKAGLSNSAISTEPRFREAMLRNMQAVSAKMACKSNAGARMQERS